MRKMVIEYNIIASDRDKTANFFETFGVTPGTAFDLVIMTAEEFGEDTFEDLTEHGDSYQDDFDGVHITDDGKHIPVTYDRVFLTTSLSDEELQEKFSKGRVYPDNTTRPKDSLREG